MGDFLLGLIDGAPWAVRMGWLFYATTGVIISATLVGGGLRIAAKKGWLFKKGNTEIKANKS